MEPFDMNIGMKIGHDENVIKETRAAIMDIVCAPAGDNVKEAALRAFTKTLHFSGMTVSHCTVTGDTTHTHHHYPEPEPEQEYDEDEGGEA
jgi:hypothetical protein